MLMILIDAVTLIVLLQVVQEESVSFLTAAIIGFVASIVTFILVLALAAALGIIGLFLGALISAAGIGVVVSAMFGVEIKRAMIIGVVFMIVHIGASLMLNAMMS